MKCLRPLINPSTYLSQKYNPEVRLDNIPQANSLVSRLIFNTQRQVLNFNEQEEIPAPFKNTDSYKKWRDRFRGPEGIMYRYEIYNPDLPFAQQWEELGHLSAATVMLWNAIHTNDKQLFQCALANLQKESSRLFLGVEDLLLAPANNLLARSLPGILQYAELKERITKPPVITPEMIRGEENELTDFTTPLTILESLAIYSRIHKAYYSGKFGLQPHEILRIGFRGFYELLYLERLHSQRTEEPINFDKMVERIVEFNRTPEMRISKKYNGIEFKDLGKFPYPLSVYASWERTGAIRPVLDLSLEKCMAQDEPDDWDHVLLKLIEDPEEQSEIIEKRAREIAYGSPIILRSEDEGASGLDIIAGRLLLNRYQKSIFSFDRGYWMFPKVEESGYPESAQDFTLEAVLEKPLQSRINNGVIETYRRPFLFFTSYEDQLEWCYDIFFNPEKYGLKKIAPTIEKFIKQHIPLDSGISEIKDYFKSNRIGVNRILSLLLKFIGSKLNIKQMSGLHILPDIIFMKALSSLNNTMRLERIINYRTTMPANDALTSLKYLYEFYADLIPSIANKYLGEKYFSSDAGGIQSFFIHAMKRLETEIAKYNFEVYGKATLRFLSVRDKLDARHANAGDRNCLLSYPAIYSFSLTDPRTNFYRILLESIERDGEVSEPPAHEIWRGGLYQITHHYNGLKIMILTGIDPQIDFHVNSGDLMNGIEKNFGRIARENGYDMVLVHDFEGSSRKGTVLKEIHSRYTVPFVLPDEEAVGFPLKVPYGDRTGDNDRDYFMMHKTFLVMHDFRDEK